MLSLLYSILVPTLSLFSTLYLVSFLEVSVDLLFTISTFRRLPFMIMNSSVISPLPPRFIASLSSPSSSPLSQVCEVTKAAREILLKAMGEGSVAPTAAEALATLDLVTVQKNLMATFSIVAPATTSALNLAVSTSDVTLDGLSIDMSSSKTTQAADASVQEYVCQMAAHLVVYDTLPTIPLNGVSEDTWKYALATTETGQWKGTHLPSFMPSLPSWASFHFWLPWLLLSFFLSIFGCVPSLPSFLPFFLKLGFSDFLPWLPFLMPNFLLKIVWYLTWEHLRCREIGRCHR